MWHASLSWAVPVLSLLCHFTHLLLAGTCCCASSTAVMLLEVATFGNLFWCWGALPPPGEPGRAGISLWQHKQRGQNQSKSILSNSKQKTHKAPQRHHDMDVMTGDHQLVIRRTSNGTDSLKQQSWSQSHDEGKFSATDL